MGLPAACSRIVSGFAIAAACRGGDGPPVSPGLLLVARIVLWIDVRHVERADAVDLDHRLRLDPGVVRHARREMDEARRRQERALRAIDLLPRRDRELPRDHGEEL